MDGNGDGIGDFAGLAERLDYLERSASTRSGSRPFQPSPEPRRRLRHHRLLRRRSALRLERRLRRVPSRGRRPRHPCADRPRGQPHLRPASLVPRARERPGVAAFATGTSGRRSVRRTASRGSSSPASSVDLDATTKHARRVVLPPLLRLPARPEHGQPGASAQRDRADHGYWLQLGVAGFRVDAVPFLLELTEPGDRPQPQRISSTCDELRAVRSSGARGDAVLLGEANVAPRRDARVLRRRRRRPPHDVQLLGEPAPLPRARERDARPLARGARERRGSIPGDGAVGALPAQPRRARPRPPDRPSSASEVFDAFGPEPSMQLYDRGIRRRLAPMLGDRRRLELAYSLLLSLPGTPVLRYGDEIGMGDDLRAQGAERDPDADAVVGRRERRVLDRAPKLVRARRSRPAPTATGTSTWTRSGATRIRCSAG